MAVVEVYADISCPFAHVGLRRLNELRDRLGRDDVNFRIYAWPLEIVNGKPLDPDFIAEEVDEIRAQVAGDLFDDFSAAAFPATSLPALALTAAAYEHDLATGEAVSLGLRDLLFEQGRNVAESAVLDELADAHSITFNSEDTTAVVAEYEAGKARGVIGSPHFFTTDGDFFCPALDIHRNDEGHLEISVDTAGFEAFTASCFA